MHPLYPFSSSAAATTTTTTGATPPPPLPSRHRPPFSSHPPMWSVPSQHHPSTMHPFSSSAAATTTGATQPPPPPFSSYPSMPSVPSQHPFVYNHPSTMHPFFPFSSSAAATTTGATQSPPPPFPSYPSMPSVPSQQPSVFNHPSQLLMPPLVPHSQQHPFIFYPPMGVAPPLAYVQPPSFFHYPTTTMMGHYPYATSFPTMHHGSTSGSAGPPPAPVAQISQSSGHIAPGGGFGTASSSSVTPVQRHQGLYATSFPTMHHGSTSGSAGRPPASVAQISQSSGHVAPGGGLGTASSSSSSVTPVQHHQGTGVNSGQGLMYELLLALQWPPSLGVEILRLLIHGAWPQNVPPNAPKGVDFNPYKDLPDELFRRLCLRWPNLYHLGDEHAYRRFWRHEWIEHGQYSGLNPVEYFELVLQLHKEVEARSTTAQMLTNLRQHSVPASYLAQQVRTEMGIWVEVHTTSGQRVINNVTQSINVLNEIRYLVDRYRHFIDRHSSGVKHGPSVVIP